MNPLRSLVIKPLCERIIRKLHDPGDALGVAFPLISGTSLSGAVTFARSSAATYVNSTGGISSAAVDVPRFGYNAATLALRGLLIEEQRTNLIQQSAAIGVSPWSFTDMVATANVATAPDGATAVDAITETAINSVHGANHAINFTSGNNYTMSAWVKQNGRTWVHPAYPAAAFTGAKRSWFDLVNGVMGTISTATAGFLSPYPNGFYRCGISSTATVTTSSAASIRPALADNAGGAYLGVVGQGLLCWGAQVEVGSFPTSYIPTAGSTVTRSADDATVTNLATLGFNAGRGTLYFKGLAPAGVAEARTLASFNDGTANNVIRLHMLAGGSLCAQVIVAGVTQADVVLGTLTGGQSVKAAMSWITNSVSGSLNGAAATTDTAVTIPTVDRLMIGRGVTGNYLCAHIEALTYYPTVQDVQALTA